MTIGTESHQVEEVLILIDLGHSNHVHFGLTKVEGEPAVQVTFYPDSRYEKSVFAIREGRVFHTDGATRPGFVKGFVTKKGWSVNIEDRRPVKMSLPEAAAAG